MTGATEPATTTPVLSELIEDYLLLWILLAVGVGLLVPRVAVVTRASTPILAVMIGSISLTLSVDQFRRLDPRAVGLVLVGHVAMPFVAFGIARALGLAPPLVVGFVVLGAVTPELVTPVMTELAGGETALASAVLVLVGVGSVAFVPAVLSVLGGGLAVPTRPIVEGLAVAVVAPMLLAIGVRAWRPERVRRHEALYPSVSAVMVVLIIGGVTAANAALVRSAVPLLVVVGIGAVGLNAVGYGLGFLLGRRATRPERIASVLSVGMRDFAVAAALLVAAGLPAVATLPAVVFGVVELTTSAGLVRRFGATST